MSAQGNAAATLVRVSTGWDKQTGRFTEKLWEGTESAINGVEAEAVTTADSYQKTPEGSGKWSLTARFNAFVEEGTEETPVSEERLRFNEVQKSIYAHPDFQSLSQTEIEAVRQAVQDSNGASFSAPLQQVLYDLILSGIESFLVYQPTVVVTDTASEGFAWNIGFSDYGKIFNTAQMISDADLDSGWKNNLPGVGGAPSGFVYGWLKKPPEIVTVAGNRTQLVQEYEFGLWSSALYDSV